MNCKNCKCVENSNAITLGEEKMYEFNEITSGEFNEEMEIELKDFLSELFKKKDEKINEICKEKGWNRKDLTIDFTPSDKETYLLNGDIVLELEYGFENDIISIDFNYEKGD